MNDGRHRLDFTAEEMGAFEPDAKVGLLGTIDDHERPHITLITTLMTRGPRELMWGQFCEGRSKAHVTARARTGYLVLTNDRAVYRGEALWRRAVTEGTDYVAYNRRPIYRYNSYFGIHTVHYMDLVGKLTPSTVRVPALVAGGLAARVGAAIPGARRRPAPLNDWVRSHLARLDTLKFIAHIGETGFPTLVAGVPAAALGNSAVVFAPLGGDGELFRFSEGQSLALFALNLKMQSVLIQGTFGHYRRAGLGVIEVDRVYNPMPPLPGYIYPRNPICQGNPITPRSLPTGEKHA